MIDAVGYAASKSFFEIGPGDGFLTGAILEHARCDRLRAYEIDPDWVGVLRQKFQDDRLSVICKNVLDVDLRAHLRPHAPWVILANLPYHVTFPILDRLAEYKDLFEQGVVMVQEEVAQRLVAQTGRSCGFVSHYYQHHFELRLLSKIHPQSFDPAPQVDSRLVYLRPHANPRAIPHEDQYWQFVSVCYKAPRQMLRNNLKGTPFGEILEGLSDENVARLRAQQLTPTELLGLWERLVVKGLSN